MRSLLFVPADSDRKIEKALGCTADAIVFDLEDSVALANKQGARETVAAILAEHPPQKRAKGPALTVRINALGSGEAERDLDAVLAGAPSAIMQPKTEGAGDVLALSAMLSAREADCGLAEGSTGIIAIATETARALFALGSYHEAGERLQAMAWGAEDLSADLGATTNVDEAGRHTEAYRLARTLCLAGAVAAGVEPIDTVEVNFRDHDALRDASARAMRDGFTGKLAIHPDQVAVINEVFTPSPDDIARAQRLVAAFAEAGNPGVVGLDGEMVDRPHLVRAERLIERAKRYGLL